MKLKRNIWLEVLSSAWVLFNGKLSGDSSPGVTFLHLTTTCWRPGFSRTHIMLTFTEETATTVKLVKEGTAYMESGEQYDNHESKFDTQYSYKSLENHSMKWTTQVWNQKLVGWSPTAYAVFLQIYSRDTDKSTSWSSDLWHYDHVIQVIQVHGVRKATILIYTWLYMLPNYFGCMESYYATTTMKVVKSMCMVKNIYSS